jgi:hypothetical protein
VGKGCVLLDMSIQMLYGGGDCDSVGATDRDVNEERPVFEETMMWSSMDI